MATYIGAYLMRDKIEIDATNRFKLAVEALIFPGLFAMAMVIKVGSQRFGNAAQDPTKVKCANAKMKKDIQILENTFEQIIIFTISIIGLSVYLPDDWLWIIPVNAILIILGRVLFFTAYHINVLYRAPGFGMTVFPAATGMLYSCYCVAVEQWAVVLPVGALCLLIGVVGCICGCCSPKEEEKVHDNTEMTDIQN